MGGSLVLIGGIVSMLSTFAFVIGAAIVAAPLFASPWPMSFVEMGLILVGSLAGLAFGQWLVRLGR